MRDYALVPMAVAVARCEHTQEYPFPLELVPARRRAAHRALAASPWCALKVYRRIGGSLDRLAPRLAPRARYAAALQLMAAVGALHAAGYVHGDLHAGNVGWVRTSAKALAVSVGGRALRVPTYGRRFLLIDVEPMRADYGLGRQEARWFADASSELKWLLLNLFVEYPFWEMVRRERLRVRPFPRAVAAFAAAHPAQDAALAALGVAAPGDRLELFALLDPEAHQRIALGRRFVRAVPPRVRVPLALVVELFRGAAADLPARLGPRLRALLGV